MTLQHGTVLAIAFGCLASLVLTADGTSVTCSAAGHCQMEGEEKSKDTVVLLQNVIHRKADEGMVDAAVQESVNGDEDASDEDGEFESDEDGERENGPVRCPSTEFCPAGHTFLPEPSMSTTMVTKKRSCAFFLPGKRWPCHPRPPTHKRHARQMQWIKKMKDLCCVAAPPAPPPAPPTPAPPRPKGCMFLGFIPCADIRVNGNRLAHPEDVCGVDGCQDCEVCWWKGCPSMCKDIKVNGNPLDKPEHACGFPGCESCPICRSVSGA